MWHLPWRLKSAGIFCRLQVAGWNLIIIGKPLALKRNVQVVDLLWLLPDAVYDRLGGFHLSAKPAEAMGGEYISMILQPVMNYCFWRNIWNIIWNICWIWFLPCEYQNESTLSLCWYILSVKLLNYFISLFICFICDSNLLLLREDPSQIWNRWKHLWSGHPDCFEKISLVSACRSILKYL